MKRTRSHLPRESVWDYPRPPRLEPFGGHIVIRFDGEVVAESTRALRVLETSHPPTYYLPREDIRMDLMVPAAGTSFCEWKGVARYFTVRTPNREAVRAAWTYPDPSSAFRDLKDYLAFYAGPMDRVTIDGEAVRPQPGGFYGGWITANLEGPFKGEPGARPTATRR